MTYLIYNGIDLIKEITEYENLGYLNIKNSDNILSLKSYSDFRKEITNYYFDDSLFEHFLKNYCFPVFDCGELINQDVYVVEYDNMFEGGILTKAYCYPHNAKVEEAETLFVKNVLDGDKNKNMNTVINKSSFCIIDFKLNGVAHCRLNSK